MDGNGELGLVNMEKGDVVAPHGQEVHPIPLDKDNLSLCQEIEITVVIPLVRQLVEIRMSWLGFEHMQFI